MQLEVQLTVSINMPSCMICRAKEVRSLRCIPIETFISTVRADGHIPSKGCSSAGTVVLIYSLDRVWR
jgi:hypothetical protein